MLVTLAAVKDELGITDTSLDTYLTGLINQAGSAIDNYLDRKLLRAAQVDTVKVPSNAWTAARLLLPRWPIISIASITLEGGSVAIDPASYVIEDADGGIVYRQRGWSPWSADNFPNVTSVSYAAFRDVRYQVNYDAGYDDASVSTPSSPVPYDLQRACIEMTKGWYYARKRDPFVKSEQVEGVGRIDYWVGGMPGQADTGLPGFITGLLDNYRRLTIA